MLTQVGDRHIFDAACHSCFRPVPEARPLQRDRLRRCDDAEMDVSGVLLLLVQPKAKLSPLRPAALPLSHELRCV